MLSPTKAPRAATNAIHAMCGASWLIARLVSAITSDSLGIGGKNPSITQHTKSTASTHGEAAMARTVSTTAANITLLAFASVSHATGIADQPGSGISLNLPEILTCHVHLRRGFVRPVSDHTRIRDAGRQHCPIGKSCGGAHEATDRGWRHRDRH